MLDAMMKEIEKYPAKYNVVFPTKESFNASNQGGGRVARICTSLATHQDNLMSVVSLATALEFQKWVSVDGLTVDLCRMIRYIL